MKSTIIGMDIAKNVFQLHTVDPETGEIHRIKLRRDEVLPFFVKRAPALVVLEACGGAHEWGRQLCSLGHEVRLLAPKSVRPFVLRNKSDAADARAIWTAVQQPEAHFVAVKTEQQQTVLALHRMREQLMKFRIMQTNALRGILYEFGIVLPSGYPALAKAWADAIASAAQRLSAILIVSLQEQWARVQSLDKDIAVLERRLADSLRRTEQCKELIKIPGVGLLTGDAGDAGGVVAHGERHVERRSVGRVGVARRQPERRRAVWTRLGAAGRGGHGFGPAAQAHVDHAGGDVGGHPLGAGHARGTPPLGGHRGDVGEPEAHGHVSPDVAPALEGLAEAHVLDLVGRDARARHRGAHGDLGQLEGVDTHEGALVGGGDRGAGGTDDDDIGGHGASWVAGGGAAQI